ncbi:eEF1A lysine and N-terminal methyltransferase-like [Dendronephthya gigantea]|uniref:eEF1A lysine and N-terminal methyltransferase-like n=1 Tax=Dendronephthya gigantea TaxID=151771 RepID=UPI001069B6AC|nr:eEF1A lysine and N-terminal methyltransferase-like [Dendronephthya gigantea]
MNLLPKSTKDFGSKRYWDTFFTKRKDVFEWYGEYSDLCGILHKYCKPKDRVLIAGCGNSKLSEDLYDVGYHSLVNVDISEIVIKQMTARNNLIRPEMTFVKMDLFNMKFDSEYFQVVLDKGTLDAIFTSDEEKVVESVEKMLGEVSRVLKVGGRYICISLAQEHILNLLLEYFPKLNWFVRVHKVETPSNASPLPVFAFVFTKTRPKPDMSVKMPQILEIVTDLSEKVNRLDNVEKLQESIQAVQEFSTVKKHLEALHPGEDFQVDLWSSNSLADPRYSLTILDLKPSQSLAGKFAIFIVPQGREHEWMFSVKEGQKQLATSAGFERLVIVALNRGHSYESISMIKEELSGKVMEFAQKGVNSASQVPFLSIGDDVGNRKVVYQGSSAYTGDYVIEDVEVDQAEMFRHLVFLSNKNVVQSEAKLCQVNKKMESKSAKKRRNAKKTKMLNVDLSHLACQHHQAIVAGFALLEKVQNSEVQVLLIGLGGGSLPMFIYTHFPHIYATVVELDPDIVDVARNWFGFQESERMKLIVADGLAVLKESSKKYDVVIFDIDAKDTTKALSCPPPVFLSEETLNCVKEILFPGGLFILNLVCRDEEKRAELVNSIHLMFPKISKVNIENEVNEVLICSNSMMEIDLLKAKATKEGRKLQEQVAAVNPSTNVELISFLENLRIVE